MAVLCLLPVAGRQHTRGHEMELSCDGGVRGNQITCRPASNRLLLVSRLTKKHTLLEVVTTAKQAELLMRIQVCTLH